MSHSNINPPLKQDTNTSKHKLLKFQNTQHLHFFHLVVIHSYDTQARMQFTNLTSTMLGPVLWVSWKVKQDWRSLKYNLSSKPELWNLEHGSYWVRLGGKRRWHSKNIGHWPIVTRSFFYLLITLLFWGPLHSSNSSTIITKSRFNCFRMNIVRCKDHSHQPSDRPRITGQIFY